MQEMTQNDHELLVCACWDRAFKSKGLADFVVCGPDLTKGDVPCIMEALIGERSTKQATAHKRRAAREAKKAAKGRPAKQHGVGALPLVDGATRRRHFRTQHRRWVNGRWEYFLTDGNGTEWPCTRKAVTVVAEGVGS